MNKVMKLLASIALVFSFIINPVFATESNATYVSTEEELKAALKDTSVDTIIFTDDITVAATRGGYNYAGIIHSGQTIDGDGHSLTVTGANDTWDCAIYTQGGTIKNLTVGGAFRGIFTAGCSSDIILDNVLIDNVCYTFNSDGSNSNYSLKFNNSTFNGWTSYTGGYKSVEITNCTFGKGTGSYQYDTCVPYSESTFTNCTFSEGYTFYASITENTLIDCKANETLITSENVEDLLTSNAADAVVPNIEAKIGNTYYATIADAIAASKDGDTVTLLKDVTSSAQLMITKAITLDLNQKTLTTQNGYGGLNCKGGCSIINGTINHTGNTAAIKAFQVEKIEDVVINVTPTEGKTKGGIVVQEGTNTYVNTIKNVTITGATNGIETYRCGNSETPVIGSLENVEINALQRGLWISAPVGTATNCTINSEDVAIELYRASTYNVTLTLVDCEVNGTNYAIYAHDDDTSNYEGKGAVDLGVDENTVLESEAKNPLIHSTLGQDENTSITVEENEKYCSITIDNDVKYFDDHTEAVLDETTVKTATCTENGYTGDKVCERCKEVLVSGEPVEATGHLNTNKEGVKPASCTEKGYTGDVICTDCETIVTKGEEIAVVEHKYSEGKCSVCGEEDPSAKQPSGEGDAEQQQPTTPTTPDKKPTVNTGDNTNIALYATLTVVALGAVVVLRKKEQA